MPSAASTPISRVRSKTAMSCRFRMPMLAISSTIIPKKEEKAPLVFMVERISGRSVSQESTS